MQPNIDMPANEQEPAVLVKKRAVAAKVGIWTAIMGLVVVAIILFGGIASGLGMKNYLMMLADFVFAPTEKVASSEKRTNILILGKSGAGFAAPDLTDTIVFASVSLEKHSAVMVSLPRDIWVPAIRAKLNSAYYWGKENNDGLLLAKKTVEEIVGQPVHYGLVIDFSGFKKLIDVLGGIEVKVVRSFVDEKYPIPGRENDLCEGDKEYKCRYETLRFVEGEQIMDGETALKFVRSRNAEGEEGTDLAREERQQKVILAVKNKILSPGTLLSPPKILALWQAANGSIETDIPSTAGAVLVRKTLSARDKMTSAVIPTDLLVRPPVSPRYDNQYVFLPSGGDWNSLREWLKTKLE